MRISDLQTKLSEEVAIKSYSKIGLLVCVSRWLNRSNAAQRVLLACGIEFDQTILSPLPA